MKGKPREHAQNKHEKPIILCLCLFDCFLFVCWKKGEIIIKRIEIILIKNENN